MSAHLLLISAEPEDRRLAMRVAYDGSLQLTQTTSVDEVRRVLSAYPGTLTFWNADNQTAFKQAGAIIPKYAKPQHIFAITERPLDRYPYLYQTPIFGHHLLRRFQGPALDFYSKLATCAHTEEFFGLARYLPAGAAIKKIEITQPDHKRAATEALQNYLTKQGLRGRIAALVAQATDEIIMNCTGTAADLAMRARVKAPGPLPDPIVKFEIGAAEGYLGISVSDPFGTFKKLGLFNSLRKQYERGKDQVTDSTALGLHGVLKAGLSLLIVSQAKVETQVMIFVPIVENHREFKNGMRFLTAIEQSSA